MSKWKSVEEGLPDMNGESYSPCVLIYTTMCTTSEDASIGWFQEGGRGWIITDTIGKDEAVTHWMYLPSIPEVRDEH